MGINKISSLGAADCSSPCAAVACFTCDDLDALTGTDVDVTLAGIFSPGPGACTSGCDELNGSIILTFLGAPSSILECAGESVVSDCYILCSNGTFDTTPGDTIAFHCGGSPDSMPIGLFITKCGDGSFLLAVQFQGFDGLVCWWTKDAADITNFFSGNAVVLNTNFTTNGCGYTGSTATVQLQP